jgi:hypothetical protein
MFGSERDDCPKCVVDVLETGVVYYVGTYEEVLWVGEFVVDEVGDCVVGDVNDIVI